MAAKKQPAPAVPKPPKPVTVRDLVDMLVDLTKKHPEMADYQVVLAMDPEGRRFRHIPEQFTRAVSVGRYVDEGFTGGQVFTSGQDDAVVLWPN